LGFQQLREFNIALSSKCCWRLKEEFWSLWLRVLSARYGEEGDNIREEDGGGLMSWNDLISIRNGVGVGVGMGIDDKLRCELGDGESILFWWDPINLRGFKG